MADVFERAEKAAAEGDVGAAIGLLKEFLEHEHEDRDRVRALTLLVNHNVAVSHHGEAIEHAHALLDLLRVQLISHVLARILSVVLFLLGRYALRGGVARTLGRLVIPPGLHAAATWHIIRSIEFALFWNDIERCPALSLLQLGLARTPVEERQALAWLGYANAYAGRRFGLRIIRHVLADAHRAADISTLTQTYPLLAVGYQMCGEPARASNYHALFLRDYAPNSPFYKVLVLTNMLGVALAEGDLRALRERIDKVFAYAFELNSSRHDIQIHGFHAVVLSAEGRRTAAEQALSAARRAAGNSNNTLDWIIFHRLAAVAAELLGDDDAVRSHVKEGRALCAAYGGPRAYEHEFDLLGRRARRQDADRYRIKLAQAARTYLAFRLTEPSAETLEARTARLTQQLALTLATYFDFDPDKELTLEDLSGKLKRTFDSSYVVWAPDLTSLKRQVLRDRGIEELSIPVNEAGEVSLLCADGAQFIGVQCVLTPECKEPLWVGVAVRGLDVVSESIVRGALRVILAQYVFMRSIRIARELYSRQQRLAAIAWTTQMLAHDVRRPFTLLRMGLETIRTARKASVVRRTVETFLPEVDASLAKVTELISNITVCGNESPLRLERVLPEAMIADCIRDTFRAHPSADVSIEYALTHDRHLEVDPARVQRVFSNIVLNAVQAMGETGRLWFAVTPVAGDSRLLSIAIGNDGPSIGAEDVSRLFDPFFTKDKPSGTGLGLAIAQHMVLVHGGQIGCRTPPSGGIEFHFTLPAAEGAPADMALLQRERALLPRNSQQVAWAPARPAMNDGVDSEVLSVRAPISEAVRLPQVAVVDDSRATVAAWRAALAGEVVLREFRSPTAFWTAVKTDETLLSRLDLLVTDFRFSNSAVDGLRFARDVRQQRPDVLIGVSSSGLLAESEIEGIADVLLEKAALPWARLRAIVEGARSRRDSIGG